MDKNHLKRRKDGRGGHRAAAAVAVALLIAGCATSDPSETAEYRYGWVDGCHVGLGDAGAAGYGKYEHKDQAKYRQAGDYRRGWDVGYKECYEEELRRPTMDSGGA